ncbi:MAG: serine/threonine-protein phosphatase [Thauera sp.]|nr:MAG: serine/threonine-protein phosphatase [Thauera sp.]
MSTFPGTDLWQGVRALIARRLQRPEPFDLAVASASDVGCERSENQDRVGLLRLPDDGTGCLAGIVADGMGGEWAGGRAAELAVATVSDCLRQSGGRAPLKALRSAFEDAHAAILAESRTRQGGMSMGTTLTVALLCDGLLYCGHVGDSRLYRLRAGELRQLSTDHSLVADMLARGLIDEASARQHPQRNVLSRAVGKRETVSPDIWCESEAPRPGDCYLICSDGLHGLVDEDTMARVISLNEADASCKCLIELARAAGGHDNISVIVIQLLRPGSSGAGPGMTQPCESTSPADGRKS